MAELSLSVTVGEVSSVLPFYVDPTFDLSFTIDGLRTALKNVGKKFTLADPINSDEVVVEGLLGVDALQYLNLKTIPCLSGVAFQLDDASIIPFGSIDNFLSYRELIEKYDDQTPVNQNEKEFLNAITNFVEAPVANADLFSTVNFDKEFDGKLEKMLSVESLGLPEKNESDETLLSNFDESIETINGKYYVEMPWTEKIKDVKPNFEICLSILQKVHEKLVSTGNYDNYNEVFEEYLDEGIVEQVPITNDFEGHVYIPHRPVFKMEENVTTKTRIVLNCSFKTKSYPSLNECCYPGINLLQNLFDLLIKIRANDFVVLSDIKKAYLMVRLKNTSDKDKFRVLWLNKKNKLVCYRYTRVVFGHIASQFILNRVVDHHLQKYDSDLCTEALSNNVYVDNLFVTHNNEQVLSEVCREARRRMLDGGFELRSWASNSVALAEAFRRDNIASTSEDTEKLLGYSYSTKTDLLTINVNFSLPQAGSVTKRKVLAAISQVFDPLGLVVPVTVGGKILMQKIWNLKLGWDEVIPSDLAMEFSHLLAELAQLSFFYVSS